MQRIGAIPPSRELRRTPLRHNDGSIHGFEADIRSLGRHDLDGFQQSFIQLLKNYVGIEFVPLIKVRFESREGKTACIADIEASPRPVFLRDGAIRELYIRAGNATRSLDLQAAHDYIGMHWQS